MGPLILPTGEPVPREGTREFYYPAYALLLLLLALMIKAAWLGDDAYILFRVCDNLLNGYGLRWNIEDRVQVFTPPLWTFVVTLFYGITHEIFITIIVLSIGLALAAVIIVVWRVSSSAGAASAALAALISSKAFVDYTSSGLENALSYLLVVIFSLYLLRAQGGERRTFRRLTLIASLIALNRLDLIVMFAPAITYVAWTSWRRDKAPFLSLAKDALIFSAPLWGWFIFSTIYYGLVFPNTYYAKLYTGIPKDQLFVQGILYYCNSLNFDPVTLLVLALALILALRSKDARFIMSALGIVVYLLYVIRIGGDFMSGRFFGVPLLFAVTLLVRLRLRRPTWLALAVLFFAVGLLAPKPSLFYNESYAARTVWDFTGMAPDSVIDRRGIADERGAYFPEAGLISVLRHDRTLPTFGWVQDGMLARAKGRHLVVSGAPGIYGFYAGPAVHIVDSYALGDPLLSKLPIVELKNWRIGHYRRAIPNGYIESLQSRTNAIEDPKIHEIYRVIKMLTQDPIWSFERFKEIVKMNTGFYARLIKSIDVENTGSPAQERASYPMAEK